MVCARCSRPIVPPLRELTVHKMQACNQVTANKLLSALLEECRVQRKLEEGRDELMGKWVGTMSQMGWQ